jgi:hemerythrin-like domain-containing protein
MLRDPNLVPLSRQHQHALALCVRIQRAEITSEEKLQAWQAEVRQHFEQEIQFHFAAEEAHVFPETRSYAGLSALVDELLDEHAILRSMFAKAGEGRLSREELRKFAETLSGHIRKEERQLFEGMQRELPSETLLRIGAEVEKALASVPQTCIVPTENR